MKKESKLQTIAVIAYAVVAVLFLALFFYLSVCENTDVYNADGANPALSFAAGYAISSEQPVLTKKDLLKLADDRMYRSKQQWYRDNRRAEP